MYFHPQTFTPGYWPVDSQTSFRLC